MISVFTPSHDAKYLDESYDSLLAQTYTDWEWVVLLNNNAEWRPEHKDRRVRVLSLLGKHGIGKLKRTAVTHCTGEILVELDHDDLLHSYALEAIALAFSLNPAAALVYSDFEQINADGTPNNSRFDPAYGWTYDRIRCIGFEPYPSAVSYIWYAPNHVRAFTREAYDAVGGYNETLTVLDDQDLMNRLYQHGDFVRIPETLYYQRIHSSQTQVQPDLNSEIQEQTVVQYDRNVESNALAWAKRAGLACLDLGGAHNSPPGYQAVDLHEPADLVGDVFEVLGGLEDGSVGVIRAHDFLEHVPDKVRLMNEIYRVLAHGGLMLSMTPSTEGRGAYQDPTHVAFWNENSFWYYTDAHFAKYVPEITCRFQVSRLDTIFPTLWHNQHQIPYVYANLVAIKEGPRLPGELKI